MTKKLPGMMLMSTALMLAMMPPYAACAAVESAAADETLFVNMDYGGEPVAESIVKHIYFGSEDSYTDFGPYEQVTDMSSGETLSARGGRVRVSRPASSATSYIEGTLAADAVTLPFRLDVTYRLNGVAVAPETLGGASGLVEIDISASPDPAASEYMRDNFVLLSVIPLTGEYYSVDAPGAQIAALGSYSALVFEALPGAEAQFVARLGTDCFETAGIMFLMSPATVSDLDLIGDIQHLDQLFRSSTDAMLSHMESMMDSVSSMSEELTITLQALSELRAAKDILHESADSIFAADDAALSDMRLLADTLSPLDSSLEAMEWLLYDIDIELDYLDDDILGATDRMESLSESLRSLGSSLDNVDSLSESEIKSMLYEAITSLAGLGDTLEQGSMSSEELDEAIHSLEELRATLQALTGNPFLSDEQLQTIRSAVEALNQLIEALETLSGGLESLYDMSITGEIAALSQDLEDISGYAGAVSFQTGRLLGEMTDIAGDLDRTIGVLSGYHEDIQGLLNASREALSSLRQVTADSAAALTLINDTLQAASPHLSDAADLSIEAGEGMASKSLDMTGDIALVKESEQELRLAVDEELDRMEEESSLLRMDPTAPLVSLTDAANREPLSVTIICRTEEIRAVDDEARALLDAEAMEEESSVIERIAMVFRRIFSFIAGLFS